MSLTIAELMTNPAAFMVLTILWFVVFVLVVNKLFSYLIKSVITKTKTKADDIVVKAGKYSVLAGTLMSAMFLATRYMDLTSSQNELVKELYIASLILIAAFFASRIASAVFYELNNKSYSHDEQYMHAAVPFMNNISKLIIFSIAGLIILFIFKVDITPALASAGFVGVALAFAAKDFVANVFGGVSVFFDKPYTIGDYVIVQEKYRGEVMEIGMRSTKIRTRDDILLTVPNAVMVTNAVVNETGYEPQLRVRIPIQVSYDSDLEKVEKVLIDASKKHEKVLHKPEPKVRYREFHDSGINLELLIVISEPATRGHTVHDVIKIIHERFRKEKIIIPSPRMDVFLSKHR